jgi:hypothetical protein
MRWDHYLSSEETVDELGDRLRWDHCLSSEETADELGDRAEVGPFLVLLEALSGDS